MNVDTLCQRVSQVNLHGILKVEPRVVTEDGKKAVEVSFWRIRGAFKNDKDLKIIMIIDPTGPNGDLYFFVPPLEECEPRELALTIYMDANMHTVYGAHRWRASEKGNVVFSYALPLPPEVEDFPDVVLFERLLKDMYEGLLFRELKEHEIRIGHDDMMSEEEKQEKYGRILAIYRMLTGPKESDDGAV